VDFTVIGDGDNIAVGDYHFTCVKTPGHTRGHMCLYEKEKKILISGDHILNDITPNISLWSDWHNPLQDFLHSLDKVRELAVEWVLPGHRTVFNNCAARIDELKEHHRIRANEVLAILRDGAQHAYQVASRMTWDMSYDNFADFPVSQKWFAAGEALAHLKYLEGLGKIRREKVDGTVVFLLREPFSGCL